MKDIEQVLKGESTRVRNPPSLKWGSGDLSRENFIFLDIRRNNFNAL